MIGNDIIDLAEAKEKSNWQRKGFLRIFTEKEKSFILNSDNPELLVWLLWSMKESAYKTYLQQYKKNIFYPLKYECLLNNKTDKITTSLKENYTGQVRFENFNYATTSIITKNLISTIAVIEKEFHNNSTIQRYIIFSDTDYRTQQQEIYNALIKKYSEVSKESEINLEIKKDKLRIPYLYKNNTRSNNSISLSHHGKYGAYAINFLQL